MDCKTGEFSIGVLGILRPVVTANFTSGIMAALRDVAVFGRRINIGADGLALTRPLLILI